MPPDFKQCWAPLSFTLGILRYYKSAAEFSSHPTSLRWTHLNSATVPLLLCTHRCCPPPELLLRGCLSMQAQHHSTAGPSLPSPCPYSFASGDYLHLQVSPSCFVLALVPVPGIFPFLLSTSVTSGLFKPIHIPVTRTILQNHHPDRCNPLLQLPCFHHFSNRLLFNASTARSTPAHLWPYPCQ